MELNKEHQLIAASASTSFKVSLYVREVVQGQNVLHHDKSMVGSNENSGGELRITELTPLKETCMMSNVQTERIQVEQAHLIKLPQSPEDFRMFIDIEIYQSVFGNDAFLLLENKYHQTGW